MVDGGVSVDVRSGDGMNVAITAAGGSNRGCRMSSACVGGVDMMWG